MSARYAVYFSPNDASPLALYGERVLGRRADGQSVAPTSAHYANPAQAKALSATPAHYGFHATLKAPFRLKADTTESQLLDEVATLASQLHPVLMQSLAPRVLSQFIALCFDEQPAAIGELAARCVEYLEPYRAALSDDEIARRNPDQLNDTQRAYLGKYGYPYVLDEFQFHMTLTGKLNPAENSDYIEWLNQQYRSMVPDTPMLDRLAVFYQPEKTSAFRRLAQFPFN